ncbi:MAG: hypothetical protein ACO2PN_17095 [Pyrobaculum sp.]
MEVPFGGLERLPHLPPRLLFCSAGCSGLVSLGLTPWRDLPPSMEGPSAEIGARRVFPQTAVG